MARVNRTLSESQCGELRLTSEDLQWAGAARRSARCAAVVRALGAHLTSHQECDVTQAAGVDAALEAVELQRVAWARIADVARVAMLALDEVERETRSRAR